MSICYRFSCPSPTDRQKNMHALSFINQDFISKWNNRSTLLGVEYKKGQKINKKNVFFLSISCRFLSKISILEKATDNENNEDRYGKILKKIRSYTSICGRFLFLALSMNRLHDEPRDPKTGAGEAKYQKIYRIPYLKSFGITENFFIEDLTKMIKMIDADKESLLVQKENKQL